MCVCLLSHYPQVQKIPRLGALGSAHSARPLHFARPTKLALFGSDGSARPRGSVHSELCLSCALSPLVGAIGLTASALHRSVSPATLALDLSKEQAAQAFGFPACCSVQRQADLVPTSSATSARSLRSSALPTNPLALGTPLSHPVRSGLCRRIRFFAPDFWPSAPPTISYSSTAVLVVSAFGAQPPWRGAAR